MNRFAKVKEILDTLVQGRNIGAHGAFWRGLSRDQFVAHRVFGYTLVTPGNGANSNLIKALTGQAPFGQDMGTSGGFMRRMPAGLPAARAEDIDFIQTWINDGCPEEADIASLDPARHNAYWRDFDNWAMFNVTPQVSAAIGEFFPRVDVWFALAKKTATENQWLSILRIPSVSSAIQLLANLQAQTVARHYGSPVRSEEVLDSYALFGGGSLPTDPLRPEDPHHQMNGREMWFVWSAFADACLRLQVEDNFWPLQARAILLGLLNDGVFRARFNVTGFSRDEAGRSAMRQHVVGLSTGALPGELATRFVASGIMP